MSPIKKETKDAVRPSDVFYYIPNLIGYARVILAAASFYYMPTSPWLCMGMYSVSVLLDAFDGKAARYFDQCSKFGSVLDMVTDRCSTTGLMCYLAMVYPQWAFAFQLLISLDISSHYMHMYSSLTLGAKSHKAMDKSSNPILRAYYTDQNILFLFCACNELFFQSLYLLSFDIHHLVFVGTAMELDLVLGMALLSGPICFGKQVISVVQLVGASKQLARVDADDKNGKDQ
ncbi:CDP-alcohol phosphatidyltransferase-domain-containing protein [Piptocephalis cylindrospora]|uniref:CDP-diacylglycerol--inositol 3-phosphatidyltransferase n=1 Tax=Piptocephalis cylindrospora TaxID=1907219 RepID=A0A4P9Y6F2_9FUNG|nr:CDP-alcohol phosphatidyltransferase-domain-containing protein [Piptocephalis cylindrospora]|eukprot:RKP14585.1 CDP-alcohol phosphatidyltransferase-domain-containing protein [Piptocephalis cylindrospora]